MKCPVSQKKSSRAGVSDLLDSLAPTKRTADICVGNSHVTFDSTRNGLCAKEHDPLLCRAFAKLLHFGTLPQSWIEKYGL